MKCDAITHSGGCVCARVFHGENKHPIIWCWSYLNGCFHSENKYAVQNNTMAAQESSRIKKKKRRWSTRLRLNSVSTQWELTNVEIQSHIYFMASHDGDFFAWFPYCFRSPSSSWVHVNEWMQMTFCLNYVDLPVRFQFCRF